MCRETKPLEIFSKFNKRLSVALQVILVSVFSILVVVVVWGVFSRYVLGTQASWSEELARLLMVWLALLGAALAARESQHLGLDVLMRSFDPQTQRLNRLFISIATGAFAAGIMAWGGAQLVEERFASGQLLPALGISRAWFYMALPVSGILITLFVIEILLDCIAALRKKEEPTK